MVRIRVSALRQAVAAVLLLVLTLSGAGRALVLADMAAQAADVLPGFKVRICHTNPGDASKPAAPARHDCCDECALCGATVLPDAAPSVVPMQVEHVAAHSAAMVWAPAIARVPTPRLSQGPPAA